MHFRRVALVSMGAASLAWGCQAFLTLAEEKPAGGAVDASDLDAREAGAITDASEVSTNDANPDFFCADEVSDAWALDPFDLAPGAFWTRTDCPLGAVTQTTDDGVPIPSARFRAGAIDAEAYQICVLERDLPAASVVRFGLDVRTVTTTVGAVGVSSLYLDMGGDLRRYWLNLEHGVGPAAAYQMFDFADGGRVFGAHSELLGQPSLAWTRYRGEVRIVANGPSTFALCRDRKLVASGNIELPLTKPTGGRFAIGLTYSLKAHPALEVLIDKAFVDVQP